MSNGVLLAFFAYASFSWGDALIKVLGGGLGVFQIAFFMTVFAGVATIFAKPKGERWRDFWRMKHPWAVQLRALSGVAAGWFGIYAFTTIPLAEAYALVFVSPMFVTILSVLVLKEPIGWRRWLAVLAGFAGVMLVVRPGFKALELGHLAGLGVAFCAAITVIVLRTVAPDEKRTSLLGVTFFYSLVCNSVAAAPGFALPEPWQLGLLALAGACSAGGHLALIGATRRVPANQIAPAHYSQMLWAVAAGALFFQEFPDFLALVGLGIIGAAGLLTVFRQQLRGGWLKRVKVTRNRF